MASPIRYRLYDTQFNYFSNTARYQGMQEYVRNLPNIDITFETDPIFDFMLRSKRLNGEVVLMSDGTLSFRLRSDSRYVHAVHEVNHVEQWSRLFNHTSGGRNFLNVTNDIERQLIADFMEIEVRVKEFNLSSSMNFDSAFFVDNASFMREHIKKTVDNDLFQNLYQGDTVFQGMIDSIITPEYFNDPILSSVVDTLRG